MLTALVLLAIQGLGPPDPEPLFARIWIGGALDSLYNAEFERLQRTCTQADDACFREVLDTSVVRLATAWDAPESAEPAGWLAARLQTGGASPHAQLLFESASGERLVLIDDVGDWGYGITLPLADSTNRRISLALPGVGRPIWLSLDGERGYDVVEIFGLDERLWVLPAVTARRLATGGEVRTTAGIYFVMAVEDGLVRFRPEIPSDMPCGDPITGSVAIVYEAPLAEFRDPDGTLDVEEAYAKGC